MDTSELNAGEPIDNVGNSDRKKLAKKERNLHYILEEVLLVILI